MLQVARYRDADSGRYRWAVFQPGPGVWYFPSRYGLTAARALLRKLSGV